MSQYEAGKYYGGVCTGVDLVEIGERGTRALRFSWEGGHTIVFVGGNTGRDGLTNDERCQRDLAENFGADLERLRSAEAWAEIRRAVVGQSIQGKAEEYKGNVSLKGLYKSGGGAKVVEAASPFSGSSKSAVSDTWDDVPY